MSVRSVAVAQGEYYGSGSTVSSQSSWVRATTSSVMIVAAGAWLFAGGSLTNGQSQLASPRASIESSAVVPRRYRNAVVASTPGNYNEAYAVTSSESCCVEEGVRDQTDSVIEDANMAKFTEEEKKLTSTINWSFGGLLVLIVLAIAGAPAVVWAPAIFSAVGVLLSCGIQLNKIDDARTTH